MSIWNGSLIWCRYRSWLRIDALRYSLVGPRGKFSREV